MTLHELLPLIAFLLNISLAGISLLRNPGSRLNRVFAYFVSAMALWNLGVFMLRRAPDEATAYFWEVIIHTGVIAIPAFYYHFVLIFLDSTTRHRPSLLLAYVLAIFFNAVNIGGYLVGSTAFIKGVKRDYWGWVPATGLLYNVNFLCFLAFMIWGLCHLMKAQKKIESSFRRNRGQLILLGTALSVAGGVVDIIRFVLTAFVPAAERIYPVGIPLNMVFALMLGISIVRYRLFDVAVAVKKTLIYAAVCAVITSSLVVLTQVAEQAFDLEQASALWIVLPLGFVITLLMSPFGPRLGDLIQRLMFSRRRGCYETLVDLSKRMSGILDFDKLVDTLVQGLMRGIPLTHCVLLIHDRPTNAFVATRQEIMTESETGVTSIRADSPIVQWLKRTGDVLVKEEVKLNPTIADYLESAEAELEEIQGSLIVPLKIENNLIGILLLGEKLSGEIFDNQELEVLSLLANQAAISLGNAALYDELGGTNARLLEANQLKSQFLASMSHELRTPLNSIIGFSKVLLNRLDGDLTERQEAYLRSVHSSGSHLLRLINGILDFTRIEAGKLDVHPEDVDLHDLVTECIDTSVPLARGKPLKIEKDAPLDLPLIRADRTKVKQVLLNLLSNAVKFTTSGRVVVRVQPELDAMHVSVADTGIGIREHDLPRLFEPFHRLNNPLSRQTGGTGLGLAISKKFIEMHGGRMWAESRENQGSVFHFTLPLARPQN
ncbi:MAG: GAF domain-containing protein [Candidatus Rokubacteria bacterium]|nr:GAF domain-containing protein [Candidatus Rokubacteria bacterium]